MYPNNELVKMGTFVIITKIMHRYSDSVFQRRKDQGSLGRRLVVLVHGLAFVHWNPGKGKTILATEEAGIIKVSNAEWRHHVVEMSHPIVIDLYKVEDESRSFFG